MKFLCQTHLSVIFSVLFITMFAFACSDEWKLEMEPVFNEQFGTWEYKLKENPPKIKCEYHSDSMFEMELWTPEIKSSAPSIGGSIYSNDFTTADATNTFVYVTSSGSGYYIYNIDGSGGWTETGVIKPYPGNNNYVLACPSEITRSNIMVRVRERFNTGRTMGGAVVRYIDGEFYFAAFGGTENSSSVIIGKHTNGMAAGAYVTLAEDSIGSRYSWREYHVDMTIVDSNIIVEVVDEYTEGTISHLEITDDSIQGSGLAGAMGSFINGSVYQHLLVMHEAYPPPPDKNIYLNIDVVNANSDKPMPAVLEMRFGNSSGDFLPDADAEYGSPEGVFSFGETWKQKVGLVPKTVWIRAWHGYEFEWKEITIDVPENGTNITIELIPRIDMTAEGWWAGGDHNHLGRNGLPSWKPNGGKINAEYVATLLGALGYDWYQVGVGSGWDFDNTGDPLSSSATVTHYNYYTDTGMRDACNKFNNNYPNACYLWFNNEYAKTRMGHLWSFGKSTNPYGDMMHPNTYPPKSAYNDNRLHNWWSQYDGYMDFWQFYLGSRPDDWYWPNYTDSSGLDLPPYHELIWANNNVNVYSIWAHLTQNNPPIFTKLMPFHLLAGVKFGAAAVLGNDESYSFKFYLHCLNKGYQFAAFGETDSAYNSSKVARNYTFIYCPEMTKTNFNLNTVADWACLSNKTVVSDGCIALLDGDSGAINIGDNVLANSSNHILRVRAFANPKPGETLGTVTLYRNGKVYKTWSPGGTSFETNVVVSEVSRAYYLLHVSNGLSGWNAKQGFTSPIYFVPDLETPLPEIIKADIHGNVYDYRANVIPDVQIDLIYTGSVINSTIADSAGKYEFKEAPADSVLHFYKAGVIDERRCPILHDVKMYDYLYRTCTGEFYFSGTGLGNVLDPNIFEVWSNLIKNCTVNVRQKDYVTLSAFDDANFDGWTFGSTFSASLNTTKGRQGNCVKLIKKSDSGWNPLMYERDVTSLVDWSNTVGMVVAINASSGLSSTKKNWVEFKFRVTKENTIYEFSRNTPFIPAGNHWHEFFLPLNSNDFHGSKVKMSANFLINPGSGGNGATIFMDELRVIIPKLPKLKPDLIYPENNSFVANIQPEFSWYTGSSATNFDIIVDGNSPIQVVDTSVWQPFAPLTESLHSWFVVAYTDGNSATSETFLFTIDATPPNPGSALFTSPAGGESWIEGEMAYPTWTTEGISDTNLDSNKFALAYQNKTSYSEINSEIIGLNGFYDWYIVGIPETISNTHLRLTIPDKAGNKTYITSDNFNLIDNGDAPTSAWKYTTLYHFDDPLLGGLQNGSRVNLSWETNDVYLGNGSLKGTLNSDTVWAHSFYKNNVAPDANWKQATKMRFYAKFPSDFGAPKITGADMIFYFNSSPKENRIAAIIDGSWHKYEYNLNSNDFQTYSIRLDMILQPFGTDGAELKTGNYFLMDEWDIFTWDEVVPEPASFLFFYFGCLFYWIKNKN